MRAGARSASASGCSHSCRRFRRSARASRATCAPKASGASAFWPPWCAILLRGFVRPGSAVYTRENGTYGLSTLRHRHARVRGRRITLAYTGKGRKEQRREIDDAPAAGVVAALLARPGPTLFRYCDAGGEWVCVRRRHLNDYLREIAGVRISAKDFRTWAGTLIGACALARQGYPEPATARALKRSVAEAMRETARLLGNTPAVCRASYVCPAVFSSYERGRLLADPIPAEALVRASPGRCCSTSAASRA